ncbi:MAG: enoyl-CoA hydratase/isomerase family protein [Calditrichaeota bacterium]|nr:enoyl-CoA hydratase/isomerase family protein [Calditrichota bacterium]MCB9365826.1 enoyl-CoA hydratase/isomerase family protein [Calditrichota bacterium]
MYETILYERTDAVLKITLNRPDRFNAFNAQMHKELADAFKNAAKDDEVRSVILTGAGKAFCSGQDLKEVKDDPNTSLADRLRKNYNPNIMRVRELEKPVICAINGVAAGAGMSLAMACDLRIASEQVTMLQAFVNVGLVPDTGSTWVLPRLLGYHKAFEICSTGRPIKAEEALKLNLVDEIVAHDQLESFTLELATKYASAPTKAIGAIKRALNKASAVSLEEALDYEAYLQDILGQTEDYREGVSAFNEKRKPNFKGR